MHNLAIEISVLNRPIKSNPESGLSATMLTKSSPWNKFPSGTCVTPQLTATRLYFLDD